VGSQSNGPVQFANRYSPDRSRSGGLSLLKLTGRCFKTGLYFGTKNKFLYLYVLYCIYIFGGLTISGTTPNTG
jgi:hypothetical protein